MMSKELYQWFRNIFDVRNILQLSKNRDYIQITFQTAHIKHKAFEIEKEWRAISFPSKDGLAGKFNRNGKDIEYFDQYFNVNSIREIIVGPSSQQEKNFEEVKLFISNKGLSCLVRKSTIPLEL
ncbi:hypothetical protein [Pedobacter immunditicola]|uniref:hypothetical protein n=1 Tax=Pedobacter immunditicola TaxID=3133440 RepID=UPI00309E6179